MEWKDEYAVGHPLIDSHHRELFLFVWLVQHIRLVDMKLARIIPVAEV